MEGVLITGGTGLLGEKIVNRLHTLGYKVHILSRNAGEKWGCKVFAWNYKEEKIDLKAFENMHHIIHLVGENVGEGRWTSKRKLEIKDSRIKTAKLLYKTIEQNNFPIKSFISASAIGYYGNSGSIAVSEKQKKGEGFLSDICKDWENVADEFTIINIKVVKVRIGVVFSKDGGALPKIIQSLKLGVGAILGTGNQIYSWVHIDDIAAIFAYAIKNQNLEGVYNGVAPQPATLFDVVKMAAMVLNKKYIAIPVPVFGLKLAMGEQSQIVLDSCNADASKIQNAGFEFKYPTLQMALENILVGK